MGLRYNRPPGWPPAPEGFIPGPNWKPDPSWPPAPPGWQVWIDDGQPQAPSRQPGRSTVPDHDAGSSRTALSTSGPEERSDTRGYSRRGSHAGDADGYAAQASSAPVDSRAVRGGDPGGRGRHAGNADGPGGYGGGSDDNSYQTKRSYASPPSGPDSYSPDSYAPDSYAPDSYGPGLGSASYRPGGADPGTGRGGYGPAGAGPSAPAYDSPAYDSTAYDSTAAYESPAYDRSTRNSTTYEGAAYESTTYDNAYKNGRYGEGSDYGTNETRDSYSAPAPAPSGAPAGPAGRTPHGAGPAGPDDGMDALFRSGRAGAGGGTAALYRGEQADPYGMRGGSRGLGGPGGPGAGPGEAEGPYGPGGMGAPYGGPGGPPGWDAMPPPGKGKTSGLAIASLVVGIVGGTIISIILGIVALSRISRLGLRGKGMATAGIVLSVVWIGFLSVAVYFHVRDEATRGSNGLITKSGNLSVFSLSVGDCFSNPAGTQNIASVTAVPCTRPHNAQVFAKFNLTGSNFNYPSHITQLAANGCASHVTKLDQKLVTKSMNIRFIYPELTAWQQGKRTVNCLVVSQQDVSTSLLNP